LRPLGLYLGMEIIPFDLVLLAQILIPVSIAYSVLRHDLFGIDRALRRGIAYSILSVLLLTFYFMVTAGLTALIANIWEQARLVVTVISLFIAAVLFEPARSLLQGLVDKALYPEKIRFTREIQSAREALKQTKSKNEVIDLLTQELPPRLGIKWASLTLAPDPDVSGVQETSPIWNAQLIVAGRSLGRYWLGPRQIGLSLENDEKEQLDGLVGQAALALAYTETIDELEALNKELEQRVLSKTEEVLEKQRSLAVYEERQRIARDLHDSISQSLFSINISARALRKLFKINPQAVMQGLSDLEEAAIITLKEMRDLLIQLREVSQLNQISFSEQSWHFEEGSKADSCDLSQILNDYCGKINHFDDNSINYHFKVASEIPPDILVTQWIAYHVLHIVKEAVHNAYKHSGEEQVTLRLIKGTDNFLILISDDGLGFLTEEVSSRGLGLKGMRERISELNGTIKILSKPSSGTKIEIKIPLSRKGQDE
jgi:signal transduction histidine kinase